MWESSNPQSRSRKRDAALGGAEGTHGASERGIGPNAPERATFLTPPPAADCRAPGGALRGAPRSSSESELQLSRGFTKATPAGATGDQNRASSLGVGVSGRIVLAQPKKGRMVAVGH